jgi:hypothetical protein
MTDQEVYERCAIKCEQLGDDEFQRLAKRAGLGLAKLAQAHYLRCAEAIREMARSDKHQPASKKS